MDYRIRQIFNRRKGTEIIPFNKLPLGEWFRFDIGNAPGVSITKKTHDKGGSNDNQYVMLCPNDIVWWIKGYEQTVHQ